MAYLKERREDDGACIPKLKGHQQLRKDLVATEILGEIVQVVAELLEKLLPLGRLLNLWKERLPRVTGSNRPPPVLSCLETGKVEGGGGHSDQETRSPTNLEPGIPTPQIPCGKDPII